MKPKIIYKSNMIIANKENKIIIMMAKIIYMEIIINKALINKVHK